MEETTQAATSERKLRKVRVGTVVSDKMQKTVVVQIEHLVKHATYRRYVRRRKRYQVHDEENQCHIGDVVSFMETRPLSKSKRWRLVEIIERAK